MASILNVDKVRATGSTTDGVIVTVLGQRDPAQNLTLTNG